MIQRGRVISIEGPDGTGKTTQAKLLEKVFGDRAILEPEPTKNTRLGQWIRRELREKRMPNDHLQMLFIANRVEHFEKLEKAIEKGVTVIMDRGELSTATYGAATNDFTLEGVYEIHRRARIPKPDLIIFLKLSDEIAELRRKNREDGKERFDDLEFQKKLAQMYEQLRSSYMHRWVNVSANGSIEEVHQRILKVLQNRGFLQDGVSGRKEGQNPKRFNTLDLIKAIDLSCTVSNPGIALQRYMGVERVVSVGAINTSEELNEAAELLARFVKTIANEVKQRWFARNLGDEDIFLLLQGEAGELGEYIAKEKRDRRNYKREIAAEVVDLMFYFAKVLNDANVNIKEVWKGLAINPARQEELLKLGNQSAEKIAQYLSLLSAAIGTLDKGSPNSGISINVKLDLSNEIYPLYIDFNTACAIELYLILKFVDRLDIDFEYAWENKMKFNNTRFNSKLRNGKP
ncbi:MAG: dTMP kinase [Candidatus Marsarchaeota archaeon]|nr:dTMP kinase [Candidatus Marsarchaeota archaeon]